MSPEQALLQQISADIKTLTQSAIKLTAIAEQYNHDRLVEAQRKESKEQEGNKAVPVGAGSMMQMPGSRVIYGPVSDDEWHLLSSYTRDLPTRTMIDVLLAGRGIA